MELWWQSDLKLCDGTLKQSWQSSSCLASQTLIQTCWWRQLRRVPRQAKHSLRRCCNGSKFEDCRVFPAIIWIMVCLQWQYVYFYKLTSRLSCWLPRHLKVHTPFPTILEGMLWGWCSYWVCCWFCSSNGHLLDCPHPRRDIENNPMLP